MGVGLLTPWAYTTPDDSSACHPLDRHPDDSCEDHPKMNHSTNLSTWVGDALDRSCTEASTR